MAYNPVNPADALDQGVNQINDAFDQVAKWFRGTTAPSSPEAGMKWYNTTDSTLYVRNDSNTTWLPCLLLDSETGLIVTDGTDTITICAPATLAGDYVLKLPATQGGSNQFLQNDGSGNLTWVSGGATGATQLNDLSDVTITGTPAAGAYIRHNGTTFVNSTQLDIDKLNITAQNRGDLIYYDGTNWNRLAVSSNSGDVLTSSGIAPQWTTPVTGKNTLADLNDVTLTSEATGDYLRYNGTAWVNNTGVTAGDIIAGSDAQGDILVRGASAYQRLAAGTTNYVLTSNGPGATPSWQAAASTSVALNDLTDVTITTATLGQTLRYDGSGWVNADPLLTDLTVAGESQGDLAYYNGTSWTRLGRGSSDQFLRATGSSINWETVQLGATSLDGLSDVAISAPASGRYLRHDGSNFVDHPGVLLGDLSHPSAADGDLIYRSGGTFTRLAAGTNGQVLTVNSSGIPSWQGAASGVTTLGGLSDVTLSTPTEDQFLRYSSGEWVNETVALVDSIGDLSDVTVTAADGDMLWYDSSTSQWVALTIGSAGDVLTVQAGEPSWQTPSSGATTLGGLSDVSIGTQAAGDLLYASSPSAWGNLAKGSDNQVLTVVSGALSWQTPTTGVTTLGGLLDVTINLANTGDYLRYNGTKWVDHEGVLVGDLKVTSQAQGDLIYRDASGWTRLGVGTSGQLLQSSGTVPAWATVTTALDDLTDVNITSAEAQGDILYHTGTNWDRLARGSSGDVLTATGTSINWAAPTTGSTTLGGLSDVTITSQAAGDLLYASSANAWGNVAVGSAGDVLTVSGGGLPVWAAPSSGATTLGGLSDVTITGAADGDYLRHNGTAWVNATKLAIGDLTVASEFTGDLIYRSASGWTRLGIGTNGQQLISNGTLPVWSDHGINNLSDVTITTPANNDLLLYNSTANQWQNQSTLDISALHHGAEAQGDLIYYDGADWNRLAKGAEKTFLRSTATSVAWETPPVSDLSDVDLSGAAAGAVIYFDGSNWIDLALGTSGQVLQAGASAPAWATLSTALNDLTDVTITSQAAGDLLYASSASAWGNVAVGSTGDVLTVSGGVPVWAAPSSGATTLGGLTDVTITAAGTGDYLRYDGTAWVNHGGVLVGDLTVASETQGDLIYRDASGWTKLGVGTSGQLLQSSGTEPTWATVTTALGDLTDVTISGTEDVGDVLYYTGSVWDRLARGSDGQVLTATASSINWETPTTGSTTLAALDDTAINSPVTGDYLRYNAGAGDWFNVNGIQVTDLTVSGEAEGDLIYHNGTSYTRLARGSEGQVLTATSSTVNWETPTTGSTTLDGLTDVTITSATTGDYLRYGGAGWVNDATVDASDLTAASGDATGDILYRTAFGYDRLSIGTNGHVLTVSTGAPSWQAPSSGDLGDLTDVTITTQATGDLLYASSGTAWGNLGIGTSGQVLSVSAGGVPEWVTSSGGGGASDLDGLSDVTITSVAGGDLLLYDSNSSQWINKAFGNFQMTTKVAKQVLYWSGANWKNEYLLPSDLFTFNHYQKSFIGRLTGGWTSVATAEQASAGDHLTWNGSDFEWMALDLSSQNLDSFADVSYTVTPAGGDLLVYGTTSWNILDASTASLGDVLTRNSSSSLGWVSTTGTGSIVKSISPTLTGTVRCDNIDATTNVQAALVLLEAAGGRTIAHQAASTNSSYTVTWPSVSQLPSSGTYYLTIDSSGNIGFSAT